MDWLLHYNNQLLPIEVKWTDSPSPRDAKHLERFLREYPTAKKGLVVCRTEQPQMVADDIEAISWRDLPTKLSQLCS